MGSGTPPRELDWFAGRLKELRQKADLTQKELAKKAGLAIAAVVHLERGIRNPSWDTMLRLMGVLGVTCQAFLQPPKDQSPLKRGRPRKPRPAPRHKE